MRESRSEKQKGFNTKIKKTQEKTNSLLSAFCEHGLIL